MVLTLAAVPLVVALQGFLHAEVAQAVVQVQVFGFLLKPCFLGTKVNLDLVGPLDQTNIGPRIADPPVDHQNEAAADIHLSHEVLECQPVVREFKVAIVCVLSPAEFTFASRVEDQARLNTNIVQNLHFVNWVIHIRTLKEMLVLCLKDHLFRLISFQLACNIRRLN